MVFVVDWIYGTYDAIKYKDFIKIFSRIYSVSVFSYWIKIRKIDSSFLWIKYQTWTVEAPTDLIIFSARFLMISVQHPLYR
jgi:hypothetical protein